MLYIFNIIYTRIFNYGKIYTKDFLEFKKYNIGTYTYGKPNIYHRGEKATLEIGSFCSIADGVKIYLGGNHHAERVSTFPLQGHLYPGSAMIESYAKGNITIGNDVWIGANACIMSGVTIGDGAIIGTNSLVLKDVGPYEIVGGNPSKHIRYRFSEMQIHQLLQIQWWKRDNQKIKEYIPLLLSSDIDIFIQTLKGNS